VGRNIKVWRPEVYRMKMRSDWYVRTLGPWQLGGSHSSQPWGGGTNTPHCDPTGASPYTLKYSNFGEIPTLVYISFMMSEFFNFSSKHRIRSSIIRIEHQKISDFVDRAIPVLVPSKPTTSILLLSYYKFLRW
jgi:hypothetical protein